MLESKLHYWHLFMMQKLLLNRWHTKCGLYGGATYVSDCGGTNIPELEGLVKELFCKNIFHQEKLSWQEYIKNM